MTSPGARTVAGGTTVADWRRTLPSVDVVLREPAAVEACATFGRGALVALIRERLEAVRHRSLPGSDVTPGAIALAAATEAEHRFALSPAPVINATGVIVHTNLGRAPLSEAAIRAIVMVASGYSAIEFDVE